MLNLNKFEMKDIGTSFSTKIEKKCGRNYILSNSPTYITSVYVFTYLSGK